MAVQKPQKTTISNPGQLGSERDGNGNQHNTRVKVKIEAMVRDATARGSNVFDLWGGDIELMSAQAPL